MVPGDDFLDVVDLAYQAAADGELWSDVLGGVVRLFGGHTGVILPPRSSRTFIADIRTVSRDVRALPTYLSQFEIINPIQQALRQRLERTGRLPKVATDQTYVEKAELVGSDFYQSYFEPFDMHSALLVMMGDYTINVLRAPGQGEFETRELELAARLQRSLDRAFMLGERFRLSRRVDEGLHAVIQRTATPLYLVGRGGRVLLANPAGEVLAAAADGLRIIQGRLAAVEPRSNAPLQALIAQATTDPGNALAGGVAVVERASGRRPLAVSVAPAPSDGRKGDRSALLSVADPESAPRLASGRLSALFGLTPGEERVVFELVAGHDPPAIAERLGVAVGTVRVQLKRAMAKIGASRQSELVSLVLRSSGGGL